MKNFCKVLGIIALVAIIGFSMVACSDDDGGPGGPGGGGGGGSGGSGGGGGGGSGGGGGGGSSGLIGKWYVTQEGADNALAYQIGYEFKSNGTLIILDSLEVSYTATGNTITMIMEGIRSEPANYYISGTELTITASEMSGFATGTYYKPRR